MIDGELTFWTIYDNPEDFPGWWVVALDAVRDGERVRHPGRWLRKTLEEARAVVRANDPSACVRMVRNPEDVPCIAETWL